MYVTINDFIGEKRIDLFYLIQNSDSSKKVAVVGLFSDNIQYEFLNPWMIDLKPRSKWMEAGIYTRQELIDLVEGKIELTQFHKEPQIKRMNKLEGTSEMVLKLDKLDNENNLEDGEPSNTLLTYHVTAYEKFTQFEPCNPQYKKLKNGELVSLALKMTHKKDNIMTNDSATTVVLHIR